LHVTDTYSFPSGFAPRTFSSYLTSSSSLTNPESYPCTNYMCAGFSSTKGVRCTKCITNQNYSVKCAATDCILPTSTSNSRLCTYCKSQTCKITECTKKVSENSDRLLCSDHFTCRQCVCKKWFSPNNSNETRCLGCMGVQSYACFNPKCIFRVSHHGLCTNCKHNANKLRTTACPTVCSNKCAEKYTDNKYQNYWSTRSIKINCKHCLYCCNLSDCAQKRSSIEIDLELLATQ